MTISLIISIALIVIIIYLFKDYEKLKKEAKPNNIYTPKKPNTNPQDIPYEITADYISPAEPEKLPYQANPKCYFFNIAEKNMYDILKLIFKDDYVIFSKVKLIDLLKIKTTGKSYWRYKGKIQQKHLDFVICDKDRLTVQLAIELDGSMHERPWIKKKDEFKNEVMETIGIPLLRIKAKQSYNLNELKEQIESTLIQPIEPIK